MTKFKAGITEPEAAFLEWALEQPEVRRINHSDWRSCAVGNYYHENTDGAPGSRRNYCSAGYINWCEYAEHILPYWLYVALNSDGRVQNRDRCLVRHLDTYGDLQRYIRDAYVENDDESTNS